MIQEDSQYFNEKRKFKGKTKDDEAIQIVKQYIFENNGNTDVKLRITEVDTIFGMTKYRVDLVPYDYTYYTLIYNSYSGIWTVEAFKRTAVKTYKTDNYHDPSGLSEYSVFED